jgi:hypothetical protein
MRCEQGAAQRSLCRVRVCLVVFDRIVSEVRGAQATVALGRRGDGWMGQRSLECRVPDALLVLRQSLAGWDWDKQVRPRWAAASQGREASPRLEIGSQWITGGGGFSTPSPIASGARCSCGMLPIMVYKTAKTRR